MHLYFARGMGEYSRYSLYSVHQLSYLDTIKIQMKIQRSCSLLFWTALSGMEDCLWNFPSHLAIWPPPLSYLIFSWQFFLNLQLRWRWKNLREQKGEYNTFCLELMGLSFLICKERGSSKCSLSSSISLELYEHCLFSIN